MNLAALKDNYAAIQQIETCRNYAEMLILEDKYLRSLCTMCAILLKEPVQDKMRILWEELPDVTDAIQAEEILDNVFNVENVDLDSIPSKVKELLTTRLLVGSGKVNWKLYAKLTLDDAEDNATNPSEKALVKEAKHCLHNHGIWLIIGLPNFIATTNRYLDGPDRI